LRPLRRDGVGEEGLMAVTRIVNSDFFRS
jgi:hypothetical protein